MLFPNRVSTAYAWVLAPVVPSRIRLGYSFSWADAQETRWTRDRYEPYFTPNDEVVHSALAELSAQAGRLSLKLNGTLGIWAR